jgi:hypothetical protein
VWTRTRGALVLERVRNRILLSCEHATHILLGVPRRSNLCRGAVVDGVHHGVPRGLLLSAQHGVDSLCCREIQHREWRECSCDVYGLHCRCRLLLPPGKHGACRRCVPERLLLHGE